MKTTKTFDGKKYHYFFNGKLFRNSTRNFKYACIATSRETGNSFMVSLGNDKQSTLKSMAHCYAHYCDLEVVEVVGEHVVKVADYMKKDWGVEVIGYYDGKCEDCAYCHEKDMFGVVTILECRRNDLAVERDGFCAWGKRRAMDEHQQEEPAPGQCGGDGSDPLPSAQNGRDGRIR